eukprot:768610-Hanusia_phi.AAC.5
MEWGFVVGAWVGGAEYHQEGLERGGRAWIRRGGDGLEWWGVGWNGWNFRGREEAGVHPDLNENRTKSSC